MNTLRPMILLYYNWWSINGSTYNVFSQSDFLLCKCLSKNVFIADCLLPYITSFQAFVQITSTDIFNTKCYFFAFIWWLRPIGPGGLCWSEAGHCFALFGPGVILFIIITDFRSSLFLLSFFFYAHCFSPTSGKLLKLKFCFP